MANFLNTSATNYFLEELIKDAKERLILISPFLKLNDRIKALLTDKNRLNIEVSISLFNGSNEGEVAITANEGISRCQKCGKTIEPHPLKLLT